MYFYLIREYNVSTSGSFALSLANITFKNTGKLHVYKLHSIDFFFKFLHLAAEVWEEQWIFPSACQTVRG